MATTAALVISRAPGRAPGGFHPWRARATIDVVPPAVSVLAAMVSAQLGSSAAKFLFAALGPAATVSLRTAFAALVLLLVWRPRLQGRSRADLLAALALGVTLAGLSLSFYAALERIPLGAALALLGGLFWAGYILLSARIGRTIPGGGGLAMAMAVAALVTLPFGIAAAERVAAEPWLLLAGLGVGLLSSVVPSSLELEALRRIPVRVFGVLMSLEPAIAALVGLVVLGERLGVRELAAIGLVVTASIGATKSVDSGIGGAA